MRTLCHILTNVVLWCMLISYTTVHAQSLDTHGNLDIPLSVDSTIPNSQSSTVRSLDARFLDVANVKDFGALGNGTNDDTAPIQNAINYVCSKSGNTAPFGSGGKVFIPSGVYVISSVSLPCNSVHIEGASNGNTNSGSLDYRGTVIKSTANNSGTMFNYTSTNADYGTGIYISNLSIDATNMTTGTLFDYSWLQHSGIRNVSILNPYNVFREEGGAANFLEDITVLGLRNIGIEFFGDASGCTDLASCNKRADLLRVNRVNLNSASGYTATCYSYHDFAQSLDVTMSTCESANFGINSYCSASMGHNGEACPAFARFVDFEAEDCTTCVNASDIQDWEFYGGYFLGRGTASTHVVNLFNTNYGTDSSTTNIGTYPSGFRVHGGRYGNSGRSIFNVGMTNVIISETQMFSSNLSDTDNTVGAPNIEVTSTGSAIKPNRVIISGNILCSAPGQQPITNINNSSLSFIQGSIWLDAGVTNAHVFGNEVSTCASQPKDFTTSNSTNEITN